MALCVPIDLPYCVVVFRGWSYMYLSEHDLMTVHQYDCKLNACDILMFGNFDI